MRRSDELRQRLHLTGCQWTSSFCPFREKYRTSKFTTIGLGGKRSDLLHMAVWRGCLGALSMVEIIFIRESLKSIVLDTQSRKEAELQVFAYLSHTSNTLASVSDSSTFFPLSNHTVSFDTISSGGNCACHCFIAMILSHCREFS